MIDSNAVVRAYLASDAGVAALVGTRVYATRVTEKSTFPAISLFTRGGISTPYIPPLLTPSKQIDCWAKSTEVAGVETSGLITARQIYRAVYDALQGIQNVRVTIGATDYYILSAIEEVQGQDLQDQDIPTIFRVLSFWSIMVR